MVPRVIPPSRDVAFPLSRSSANSFLIAKRCNCNDAIISSFLSEAA